jgi:hypothetical protein
VWQAEYQKRPHSLVSCLFWGTRREGQFLSLPPRLLFVMRANISCVAEGDNTAGWSVSLLTRSLTVRQILTWPAPLQPRQGELTTSPTFYSALFSLDQAPTPKVTETTASIISAGILEQSMGASNRVGIRLSYLPARLHRHVGRYDNLVPTRFLAPKNENQIFLIYMEIQSGAVAKSYMRKGFLIYEEMCKYFPIYEEVVSHIWLWNCSIMNFLIYEENLIFFFIVIKFQHRSEAKASPPLASHPGRTYASLFSLFRFLSNSCPLAVCCLSFIL